MAPPDAAAPAAPGHRLALPLLLMLCAATYLPTLQGGFVWDDHQLVGDRAELLAHGSLRDFFSTSLFGAAWGETLSVYYRPMVLLSLALDQRLWEGDPFGFHLQNLGWHLLAVGVCHALLRRLASPAGALVGTALFAMHPLQSEAVGWISGRAEPMALVGMTLAVLLAWPARPGAARSLGAGLSLLLALLTKETALTTLALVPMLDVARWGRPRGATRYAALLAAVGLWAAMRAAAGVGAPALQASFGPAELASALRYYPALLWWPWPLTGTQSVVTVDPAGPGTLATVALLAAMGGLAWRGRGVARAGLLFALLAFAITLPAVLRTGFLGDRYVYIPLLGMGVAVAHAWPASWPRAALLPVAGVVLGWAALLQGRVHDWRDDERFQQATVDRDPHGMAWKLLGDAAWQRGDADLAAHRYRQALDARPAFFGACAPYAGSLLDGRAFPELVAEGWRLGPTRCAQAPEFRAAHAIALALEGQPDAAAALLARCPDGCGALGAEARATLALLQGQEAVAQQELAGLPVEAQDRVRSRLPASPLP